MANTFIEYTGNGSTTNYSFTFEYIKESEVKVTIDGASTTAFTFANATTLSFTTAPANNAKIRIYRETDVSSLKATFFAGSAIKAEDLNDNFTQNNFAVEELRESTFDFDTETIKSNETWSSVDTQVATTKAIDDRTSTLIQTGTPSGSDHRTGNFWYQNDEDQTFHIWTGSNWEGITSGGTFTTLEKVIYVDSINGNDSNEGHRISTPKATIKAAVEAINNDATYGDGSVVLVAPGIYQEAAPIDIQKRDVAIIGASVRNVIVHPTPATETSSLFRVNSGTYLHNMTFTGMKASGTRGATGSLWEDSTYGLPPTQGWNVSFYPDAMIYKSPYIQNCTNFSDSEIDNSNLDFYAGTEDKGRAGDFDSAPTGGGLLIDGSTPHNDSPLRSIVCDSYTHTGLDAPGIFVTNNGYCQATSSYAFFNHFHIACLNGGQANLAASTSDFGRYSLIASGRSPNAVLTASTSVAAADGATTFTTGSVTSGSDWHGGSLRPSDNMLVDIGGNTYAVISAVPVSPVLDGFVVTISRPDPNDRTQNLGLDGAVSSGTSVSFYLRSMIASSGHTMEYVGSGTDYTALPENGGTGLASREITELNNGKVWAATTDHRGTFTVGDTFSVNQQTGFVNIPAGAFSVQTLLEDLNVNGKSIVSSSNGDITLNPNGTGDIVLDAKVGVNTASPGATLHVEQNSAGTIAAFNHTSSNNGGAEIRVNNGYSSTVPVYGFWGNNSTGVGNPAANTFSVINSGSEKLRIDSSGRLLVGTSAQLTAFFETVNSHAVNGTNGPIAIGYYKNNQYGPRIDLIKSRSTTINGTGAATQVDNGDILGEIYFGGSDGSTGVVDHVPVIPAARIFAEVNGTPGYNDMPGRLVFATNAGSGSNPTERMEISPSGNICIGGSAATNKLDVNGTIGVGLGGLRSFKDSMIVNDELLTQVLGNGGNELSLAPIGSQPTSTIKFKTAASSTIAEQMRLDSSGRLLIGLTASKGDGASLQVKNDSTNPIEVFRGQDSTAGPTLLLNKSRGSTAIPAAVQENDELGAIAFKGYQTNTSAYRTAALISCFVDGEPNTGQDPTDMPGRLVFSTSADASGDPTARMVIDKSGNVGIGTTDPDTELHITASGSNPKLTIERSGLLGATWSLAAGANTLFFKDEGSNATRMTINSSGNVGIGTTSPASKLYVTSATGDTRLSVQGGTNGDGILSLAAQGTGLAKISFWDQLAFGKTAGSTGDISNEYLRINNSGNVGINTSSPVNKLDVDGAIGIKYDQGIKLFKSTGTINNDILILSFVGSKDVLNIAPAGNASSEIAFKTSSGSTPAERMRIDSSGNVNIGTTTAASNSELTLRATSPHLSLYASPGNDSRLNMGDTDNHDIGMIAYANSDNSMRFTTNAAERMRLQSNGTLNCLHSDNGVISRSSVAAGTSKTVFIGQHSATSITNGASSIKIFTNGNVQNTNNSYGSLSDAKLKENIVDASSQWDDIKDIRVRNYNFIEGQTHTQIGVVAQEVETVSPGLVTESPDTDNEGNDLGTVTKSVNYSVLYMKAVKALQEAMDRIETLETKVAALEAGN